MTGVTEATPVYENFMRNTLAELKPVRDFEVHSLFFEADLCAE